MVACCRLIGKVAADHNHKWVFKEPQEQEMNLISSWSNPADSVSAPSEITQLNQPTLHVLIVNQPDS